MQYELGDIVLFDGGPALIIGRDTEDRTYLIEFTGLTGKRKKTVTGRDLDDAPTEWHISNHLDLAHEVMAMRKEVKGYGLAPADTGKTVLDEQIEIRVKELVGDALSFCDLVSGAINCYEDGSIKDMMKEMSDKVRRNATRVMAYTDVRDSHRE